MSTGWLLVGRSACLLRVHRTKYVSRDGTHQGLGPPISIFNLENAPEILLTGQFEDSVSDMTLVFVKLTKKTNQATFINFQVVGFVLQKREIFLKTKNENKQTITREKLSNFHDAIDLLCHGSLIIYVSNLHENRRPISA